MSTPAEALNAGIHNADGPEKTRERADVDRWMKRIAHTRRFDESARRQYVKDRRYARGDSGFEVDANIIGTFIDILVAFLAAKNPDVDIGPADSAQPPTPEQIQDAAAEEVGQMPVIRMAVNAGLDATAIAAGAEMVIQKKVDEMRQAYKRRLADLKSFAETSEIIVSRLWKDAKLKVRGRRMTLSALTVGIGIIKASWQERTAPSPETVKAIGDIQDNIARARALQAGIAESDAPASKDHDADLAELERQLAHLQAQPEPIVDRGFVVDTVAPEDFVVAPGFTIADHCDAPWNAHRFALPLEDAAARFKLTKEQQAQATKYYARTPESGRQESPNYAVRDATAEDADAFTKSDSTAASAHDDAGGEAAPFVMGWEIWDMASGHVLTAIEGIKCWVKPAWQPTHTQRFYGFFVLPLSEVDGQRHPQSYVTRSAKLIDEYNRIGSAEAEHRRRSMPGVLFDKGAVMPDSVKAITKSLTGEYTGVDKNGKAAWSEIFFQKPYNQVDPTLYDRQRIVAELERIWGVQEALSGGIQKVKTAREADIQQTGFNARSDARRDLLEAVFDELAIYTLEVSRAHVDLKDAQAIAGPDAFWPQYGGADDSLRLLDVTIRAGTSGKPNSVMEREAWSQQLPLLQAGIQQIAQLRASSPNDVADCLEQLLRITAARTGDRLDVDALIPQAAPQLPGAAPPGAPGAPASDGAPPAGPTDQPPGQGEPPAPFAA